MNCREIPEQLSAFLDGELSTREAEAVREHVASCDSCGAKLDALAATITEVNHLSEVRAPEGLKQSIMAEVEKASPAPADRPSPGHWRKLWPAAAAILIAIFLGYQYRVSPLHKAERPRASTKMAQADRRVSEAVGAETPDATSEYRRGSDQLRYEGGERRKTKLGKGDARDGRLADDTIAGKGFMALESEAAKRLRNAPKLVLEKSGEAALAKAISGSTTVAWTFPSKDPQKTYTEVSRLLKKKGFLAKSAARAHSITALRAMEDASKAREIKGARETQDAKDKGRSKTAQKDKRIILLLTPQQQTQLLALLKKAKLPPQTATPYKANGQRAAASTTPAMATAPKKKTEKPEETALSRVDTHADKGEPKVSDVATDAMTAQQKDEAKAAQKPSLGAISETARKKIRQSDRLVRLTLVFPKAAQAIPAEHTETDVKAAP